MLEHHELERKSLTLVSGPSADWEALARTCVCLANARGGALLIGIEDGRAVPPAQQRIPPELPQRILKRVSELTINVGLPLPVIEQAANGGEYVRVMIPASPYIASTSDGRYFLRISDDCKPVPPDEIARLAAEKSAFVWELQPTAVRTEQADAGKRAAFLRDVRGSDRVSAFVKQKSDDELLRHYFFERDGYLTNLGVLWIGRREDRAALAHAPVVQFLRFDGRGIRVVKRIWDDYALNPAELLREVLALEVWDEAVEIPQGATRERVPIFDREVVRELVANALVHRAYTQRGDLFLNHHPDRLEIHSPGRLPAGVTPANILHQSVPRNPHLAKVFYDLVLMEREGSGYDKVYEVLLSSGKETPTVAEGADRVTVTVSGRIRNLSALRVVERAQQAFDLTPRETITLGLIALYDRVPALELVKRLALSGSNELRSWMGGLRSGYGLVLSEGEKRATVYFVNPGFAEVPGYRSTSGRTTVGDLQLRERILADLREHPRSLMTEIWGRLSDVPREKVRRQLSALIPDEVSKEGRKRGTRYSARPRREV